MSETPASPLPKQAKVKPRLFWLTKDAFGRYLISLTKPKRGFIPRTRIKEIDAPFDPFPFRGVCEGSVVYLTGKRLPPLTPTRIRITVEYVN